MPSPVRRLALWLLMLALLGACASPRPVAPDTAPALQRLIDSGYPGRPRELAAQVSLTWLLDEQALDVTLLAPAAAAARSLPLLVYLPGLGEPAQAGSVWRRHWAARGYAVLSVQPQAQGVAVWRSPAARSGDFAGVARAQFALPAAAWRLACLRFALDEVQRLAAANQPWFAQVDPQQVVLAGYDLGAQTVALALGAPHTGLAAVRAALLISPYADNGGRDMAAYYARLKLPVLVVTGSDDLDPYRLMPRSQARQQPFDWMPDGGKYLLVLAGGSHGLLAGDGLLDPAWSGEDSSGLAARRQAPEETGRGRRLNADAPASATPGGGRTGTREGERGQRAIRVAAGPLAFDPQLVAGMLSVSSAFLDATVRQDATAAGWLAGQSGAWLGSTASLRRK